MNLATIVDPHPPDGVALMSRGQTTTYGDLREQAGRLRGGFASLGLQRGDRVGIVAANNWYFAVSYLAALGAGLVAVPLNPSSPAAELTRELAAIGAKAVVVGPAGKAACGAIDREALPVLEHIICSHGAELPGSVVLDDIMGADPAPVVEVDDDELAVLIFTSGTAGSPKAAMLSHGNLRANLEQVQANADRTQGPDDVVFGVLPLFHIFGLNVVLGLCLYAGSTALLVERFDPVSALETIRDLGVTIVSGAPTMWAAWAALTSAQGDEMAMVRLAASGAAKLPDEVAEGIDQRFGIALTEGYGLTECSPVVTTSQGRETRRGSIGSPLGGLQVRLVDADGQDVLVGDPGEIWVRGPNVFQGYWNDPVATRAALTADGWLRTGDIAVVDDDGYLFLVNRAKDLIIVSGFNVYPAEVEEVLATDPGVDQVAVVGVEHPHTGEAVKAYVVAHPGESVEEDALIEHCGERLARYKCPTKVMFVDELPRGLGGKILRRALS